MSPYGQKLLKLAAILVILTAFFISPVTGTYGTNGLISDRHLMITDPSEYTGTLAVGLEDDGKTIESSYGNTISVILPVTGPFQKWKYVDSDNAPLVGYTVIPASPAEHQFKLRINAIGPVRFILLDDRDGKVLKEFKFYLALKMPLGGR
jgi:hypothetical protein